MLQYRSTRRSTARSSSVPGRRHSAAARSRGRRVVQGRSRYAERDAGIGDSAASRRAQRRRQVARAGPRTAARAGRRSHGHGFREAACIALQGPHLRLDAIPVRTARIIRRRTRACALRQRLRSRRRGRPAKTITKPACAPQTSRGIRTARRSRSRPTTRGRTSRPTSSLTSTP